MNHAELKNLMNLMDHLQTNTGMKVHFVSNENISEGKSYLHLNPIDYSKAEKAVNEYEESLK